MIESIIARRYAKGLALVAQEKSEVQEVAEQLGALADLMDTEEGAYSLPELLDFLASPTVRMEAKIKLTDLICEKMQIGKTVSDFLNVLIEKHRVPLTGRISREYNRLVAHLENTRTATIVSAHTLDDTQEKKLVAAVEKIAGQKVRVRTRINPRLIGGARVFLDDILIDDSIAARLNQLESHLT